MVTSRNKALYQVDEEFNKIAESLTNFTFFVGTFVTILTLLLNYFGKSSFADVVFLSFTVRLCTLVSIYTTLDSIYSKNPYQLKFGALNTIFPIISCAVIGFKQIPDSKVTSILMLTIFALNIITLIYFYSKKAILGGYYKYFCFKKYGVSLRIQKTIKANMELEAVAKIIFFAFMIRVIVYFGFSAFRPESFSKFVIFIFNMIYIVSAYYNMRKKDYCIFLFIITLLITNILVSILYLIVHFTAPFSVSNAMEITFMLDIIIIDMVFATKLYEATKHFDVVL